MPLVAPSHPISIASGPPDKELQLETTHSQQNHTPSTKVAFYLDTSTRPNLLDSCYCVLLGNEICYCEHYYSPDSSNAFFESVTDPPPPLQFACASSPVTGAPPPPPWRSPTALGVTECPLGTPSSSSGSSPTLSPLIENESDSGGSGSGGSSGVVSPVSVTAPASAAAAAASAGGVAGAIDISRLRFECRWDHCRKMFKRPSDLTKHERYHVKEYLCPSPGCDKAFATQKDLKRHGKTHGTSDGVDAADAEGYRCRVAGCRKAMTGHVYNRRDNFVRHLRTKHVGMELEGFVAREETMINPTPMEAIAAVALAGNVAQFLEYAVKGVSKMNELLKSPDGTLKEDIDLRLIADGTRYYSNRVSLNKIAKGTETRLEDVDAALATKNDMSLRFDSPTSPERLRNDDILQDLVSRCLAVAGEILGILELPGIWAPRSDIFLRVKIVTKTFLKRSELKELWDKLCALRDQVSAHLLVLLLEQQSSLDQTVRNLWLMSEESYADMGKKLDTIIREIRVANQTPPPDAIVHVPVVQDGEPPSPQQSLEKVLVFTDSMLSVAGKKRNGILDSLHFGQLEEREWAIPDAHRETFEWIFKGNSDKSTVGMASGTFIEWLQQDDGVFWVTGKAGSGKSTLMKFLTHHAKTNRLLSKWAGDGSLIIAQHYFWSSGTTIQKSHEGLLRALLFQILTLQTGLMPVACPRRWNSPSADSFSTWSRAELLGAFDNLGEAENATWKICLFIDGLDEYHGDPAEMVDIVQRLEKLPRVKVCASSRPWIEFSDAFEKQRWKLYLHDLTTADIHRFVRDNLAGNERFDELQRRRGEDAEALSLEITRRAQGVFLWVFLVVRSLVRGLKYEDNIRDLQTRLRGLPTDLKETFDRMLATIEDVYRVRTARLFLTLAHAASSFPVVAFYFMEFGDGAPSREALPFLRDWPDVDLERARALDAKKRQLVAQCKDLIFITPVPDTPKLFDQRVGFLHRTVVDYIKTEDVAAQLARVAGGGFNPDKILLDANVGLLRSLVHQHRLVYIRPHLRQWVLGALYYARRIEVLSDRAEVGALDDLEAVIMGANKSWDFGHAIATLLDRTRDDNFEPRSFLELVCRCDMASYVRSRMPELTTAALDTAAPGWRSLIDIRRGEGFEVCDSDRSEQSLGDWRLGRLVRSSTKREELPGSRGLSPLPVDSSQASSFSEDSVQIGAVVSKDGPKRRDRVSSRMRHLFRRK
ncbi:hypothetical protein CkaCkLH20_08961 [Colletotrichum karsti]|uniref:C2H2-type domain-containing protein n=1 Tax=Colletotrichum karsti TaxID=1095194 RepID=A0A9P6I0F1_9PEZI|nr:uncharacterized protein CkaCkLH20_08961 [Colletotrichum karsti]KAF9873502.1 hypothetical protein CkaCkLH20_08961 [Colletotrichum karsti]